MSTGTVIIQRALQKLGAHSVARPAAAESIVDSMDTLNGLIQEWESQYISLGAVPLSAPGEELSEPADARNAIVENLAVRLYPDFPSISEKTLGMLRVNARVSYNMMASQYQNIPVARRGVSSTMPMGAGNQRGRLRRAFAGDDATVGD